MSSFHSKQLGASALLLAFSTLTPAALAGGGANGLTDREVFLPGGSQVGGTVNIQDASSDGRYLTFDTSEAMLPGDANGVGDVYVLDRQTGALQCASVNALGNHGTGLSRMGRISEDGRFVVFETLATDLIGLDGNATWDVLRKDLQTGALVRVSAAVGSFLAADDTSYHADISADGRYVVFQSQASNLLPGVANGQHDIYWRDMDLGVLTRLTKGLLSEPNGDSWHPRFTPDGLRVAYYSYASNLVLHDTNGERDVFVTDVGGGTSLVSRTSGGTLANGGSHTPLISADGQVVIYTSSATNLSPMDLNGMQDVYSVDLTSGVVQLVTATPVGVAANGHSQATSLSADGRYAVFFSLADDLTNEFNPIQSVYLRDLETQTTALVSRSSGLGNLPNGSSYSGVVNAGGSLVFFSSLASNLDQGDTNGVADVFSRTLFADPMVYCVSSTTSAGCQPQIGFSGVPSASANAGFQVTGSNLPNNKLGILFYGVNGKSNIPFLGGALCTPTLAGRTPGLVSGGNPGVSDCSGSFTIDMNAFAAGVLGGSPSASLSVIGQTVNCQFWGRDPAGVPFTSFLSDALEYVVGL